MLYQKRAANDFNECGLEFSYRFINKKRMRYNSRLFVTLYIVISSFTNCFYYMEMASEYNFSSCFIPTLIHFINISQEWQNKSIGCR